MKNPLLLLVASVLLFSSCEIVVVEEPVPVVIHDERDHFTGFYDVDEYSETFNAHAYYTIDIVKSAEYVASVYINNFYGVGISILADIDGYRIYIPEQEVDGYHISGEGSIDGNELVLSYSVHDHIRNTRTDYCSTVAWR